MSRISHAVREIALIPLLVVWGILSLLPVRVPDLRRVMTGDGFAARHDIIVAWLDRHFELIEAAAPWLSPAGRRTVDRCVTRWDNRPFAARPDPPTVRCRRTITCAYGCDGDLESLLAELTSALYANGWGRHEYGLRARDAYLGPPAWPQFSLDWRPTTALRLPPGLETIPPDGQSALRDSMQMAVDWASLDNPGNVHVPSKRIGDLARPNSHSQPVEVGGDEEYELAARALSRHEYVITIELTADYYYNANVYEKPDRLRRRLWPVFPFYA